MNDFTPARPHRLRFRFERRDGAAALSQLEQIKKLRGFFTASGLPVAMSGTLPKIAFGPAIAAGYESMAEYADVFLSESVPAGEASAKVAAVTGEGFVLADVKRIPAAFPSLESLVTVAEFEIRGEALARPPFPAEDLLGLTSLPVTRVKKGLTETVDARPAIAAVSQDPDGAVRLLLRLGGGRGVKPENVVAAWLGLTSAPPLKIVRKQLYWENENGGLEAP